MKLVQALALVTLSFWMCNAQESFSFGCNSMDIINPPTGRMTTAFPGRMTCVRKPNSKDIWADVYAKKRYVGVMVQVHKSNGVAVGSFRTARGDNPDPNAVGDLHVVGCPGNVAQYSRDQTTKAQSLATWTSHGSDEDMNRETLYCVFTVVETRQRRYVKIKIPAESRSSRPTKPDFSVTRARTNVPSQKPPPIQPVRRTQPSPAPRPRPAPQRQNTRVSRSRGSTTVDGHRFQQHCIDSKGLKRIPVQNSDCLSYYTATTVAGLERIRAYQSCRFGMALSVSTCECKTDTSVTCGAGTISSQKVTLYDSSNNRAGTIENAKSGNSKSLNIKDSTNPSGISKVSSSGQPSLTRTDSSDIDAFLSIIAG